MRTIELSDVKSRRTKNLLISLRAYIHNTGLWQGPEIREAYWAHVARLSFVINTATQIITLFLVTNNVAKLFECFSIFAFCCMGVLKLNSLRKYSKEWLAVLSLAQELEDYTLSSPSDVEYESEDELAVSDNFVERNIESYRRNFVSTSKFVDIIYIFTLMIFVWSPFIEYTYRKIYFVEIVGYPHVLPGWAPLDSFLAGYVVTIVFEIIAAVYCVMIHLAFDIISLGLMIFLSGQFALLHERSSKIGGEGKYYQFTLARDNRAHHRIIQCHRSHIILVK